MLKVFLKPNNAGLILLSCALRHQLCQRRLATLDYTLATSQIHQKIMSEKVGKQPFMHAPGQTLYLADSLRTAALPQVGRHRHADRVPNEAQTLILVVEVQGLLAPVRIRNCTPSASVRIPECTLRTQGCVFA